MMFELLLANASAWLRARRANITAAPLAGLMLLGAMEDPEAALLMLEALDKPDVRDNVRRYLSEVKRDDEKPKVVRLRLAK